MPHYRLYFMQPYTGQILRFAEYEAPGDDAALALAREHEGEQALELWSGCQKIQRIEPADAEFKIAARWKQAHAQNGQPSPAAISSDE